VPPFLAGLGTRLIPVHLRRSEVDAYYHGFANRTLWPLFHSLADRAVLERRWWRQYAHVNELFA
jgi:trehalose-6-phosphate synthase